LIHTTTRTTLHSPLPGPKKKILFQNNKSIVFPTDDKVAVKCTSHLYATVEVVVQALLLPRGPNDNIVTLLGGTILDDQTVELFYEFVPLELWPSSFWHSSVVRTVIHDLILGVHILHTAGLAHRDLKFPNLRLTKEGRTTILDLDSAGYGLRSTDIVTTIVTRAPEILDREIQGIEDTVYDPKPLDLWSLGILALELAQGRTLQVPEDVTTTASIMWKVLDEQLPKILSDPRVQETLGPKLFNAIRQCVSYSPELRPTIDEMRAIVK
jgi:serine/threonine protein kinase